MKRILSLVVLALLFMGSCGKKEPGAISIDLGFNSTVTPTIQDSIDQFVFIIGEVDSSKKLLYPSSCLGCSSDTTPCPVSDQCLKSTNCGFSASDETFDPEISFEDVAEGKNMQVIACALDNSSSPVAAGQGTVKNRANDETTITMTSNATICINNLPSNICD